MKTKIIYISGNEVFDMADIRAAFDEVRRALDLGSDTVLFGVPVDKEDALAAAPAATPVIDTADAATEQPAEIEEVAPIKKGKRTARRAAIESVEAPVEQNETAQEKREDIVDTPAIEEESPVIPILSVLASKSADAVPQEVEEAPVIEEMSDEDPVVITDSAPEAPIPVTEEIETVTISAAVIAPDAPDDVSDAIDEMITDDTPAAPVEKTLEQLLESMTPLREDIAEVETEQAAADDVITDEVEEIDAPIFEDDSDATLAQLASEFAESQDKIPATRPETQGKIGKLKNILPFKRGKREDTGLMGDLFGWAGIAANDDDFALPGFFANATGKK